MMEKVKIEIRTSEIDTILGKTPNWIMRTGISVICISALILLIGSMFFYYPETIQCDIRITTNLPPSQLVTKEGGLIKKLYAKNNEIVVRGQVLAMLENPANEEDILWLKSLTDTLTMADWSKFAKQIPANASDMELGEITPSFSNLQKAIEAYRNFTNIRSFEKKGQSLQEEIGHTTSYETSAIKKYQLACTDYEIAAKAFERDSVLFNKGAATAIEYEQSKSILIQKKVSLMDYKAQIENIRIQKSQLKYSLIENQDQSTEKKTVLIKELEIAFKNVYAELNSWIQKYAIIAPYKGKASFTKYWSVGQYVTPGEEVMTVIPINNPLIGKLVLPPAKSGKVKIGQSVNIKLDGYPYTEYGIVQGYVQAVSLISFEKNYLVDVSLPEGLHTNYGETLEFTQEMSGKADIITEDMTLFERFCYPIRSILKNIKSK